MALPDGYFSLNNPDNRATDTTENIHEGVSSDLTPELTLDMSDDELIDLKEQWLKTWAPYEAIIKPIQQENEDYWIGKQFDVTGGERPMVDNIIFESFETFLPIATRPKADVTVDGDGTEAGQALADKVRKMVAYRADVVCFNLKLKSVARYWGLYLLGAMKIGWSIKENDITCVAIRPQKLILDPKATIEEGEYNGYYIGEYIDGIASDLVARFPNQTEFITDKVKNRMGTTVEYIMWTTDEYVFWTLDKTVLGKSKNPHWNYDQVKPSSMSVDEMGNPIEIPEEVIPGKNHFNSPKKNYVFLNVFNLGKQPHDDTNLIRQNIPMQDLINKRLCQIDKNADSANGALAVSGDAFTEEQTQKIANARRKGSVLWIPNGDVNSAIRDLPAQPLPNFVYESLIDYRNELRNIFGTRGSTAQGTFNEKTLGGKQIVKSQDSDRIGGGISTYLEQFADKAFNWFVQLMYVYYDEKHAATVLGAERAKEYITLSNDELFDSKLLVGVKEGSMVPQDPMSKRNEAVELWTQSGIDPIAFFDRLEFPNPRESAKNLYLWKADPIRLFPDLYAEQLKKQEEEAAQNQQMMEQKAAEAEQKKAQDQIINQNNELQKIELQNALKQ